MKRMFRGSPGGTLKSLGGLIKALAKVEKSVAVFLCWGLLIGYFFINQSLVVMAQGPGSQELETEIPKEIIEYCEVVGSEYDICPELLESMAYQESRFIPTVKNGKHYGLLQVNVKVHADRIAKYGWTEEDMFDPYKNIMVAADYLSELYEIYGDENPIVLSVYSGNWKAVKEYKETGFMTSYVEEVLERSAAYERLHEK